MRTGVAVDSTPIYTELQKTLIDPEADHWDTSAPPEFVSSLDEQTEHSQEQSESRPRRASGRSGGRRHRAED
ncbi:hypothetical protein DFQ14_108200 [Halopolyspora algeriensis]|uniref:Uncharacterized protein n=1 Tax=Halopolyspora algeriensis TaxID=1500506 RepID=A0A368VMK3_9ACTN|nr:hypothetical protein [Halopolyspora algeriensis]RCW42939.1 hypothetical protein DFQ14_108200 [Halopolyspora algeriensis]TQM56592.1 hypothetical protein FHU43_1399 [Halopolyspora algeriensis]